MKKLISFISLMIVFLYGCGSRDKDVAKEKENYQKAKETLEEKEKKNPATFLIVDSRDKHNLLGQTVVNGRIKNMAKVCVYKDVRL